MNWFMSHCLWFIMWLKSESFMDLGNVKDLEISHLSASCPHTKCETENESVTDKSWNCSQSTTVSHFYES